MIRLIENLKAEMGAPTPALEIIPVRTSGRCAMELSFSDDRLTLSVVHDLRNPLSTISGAAELLATGRLGPEQTRRIASNIRRACQQMKDVLSGFVYTVKGHKEHSEISNLRTLLCASCKAAGIDERPDIALTIDVAPEIDLRVNCRRMERAFVNLIVNAIEAMPGGGAIYIEASATADRVQIGFEDTGPGIPAIIRDRLFEPFATAGKPDGMGLGLAISREVVRHHGGELWTEPSRGARFAMWLPQGKRAESGQEEAR